MAAAGWVAGGPSKSSRGAQGLEGCAACGVQQSCLSSELGVSKSARWHSRASSLLAFQDRAPQGTLREAEGKRLGHQPPTPQRPRSVTARTTNRRKRELRPARIVAVGVHL